ncbi:MAG TPA: glycoside hydrolase family 28 protein [Thermoanaerobaculia bacterium]|nr:glycoside hydrolase family 28 protein [Thermoanaerobaculia bacterium]
MITRREILRDVLVASAGIIVTSQWSPGFGRDEDRLKPLLHPDDPWAAVPDILGRIVPPVFPKRDFLITRYGGDIAKAINACHRAGGGRVVVPKGDYLTGPVRLLSRVELHLDAGATLRFSNDPEKYPLVYTRWEGVELMNYSPLVYAFECEDVAVTGDGTLDGQADEKHWWNWKPASGPSDRSQPEPPAPQVADRMQLMEQAEHGLPVEQRIYGKGHFLRPTFIEPYRCRNVLIEGVTVKNAPFWNIHPTLCTNVTVRGVKVIANGPNTDGCDPESCRGVLIEDCVFDTGDDCIALKSGRNADGRRVNVPVEDVIIRRLQMKAGHGGITIGSEISGGARNIFAEKCTLDSPTLERGLRMKSNTMRGGVIENVFVRDIEIGNVLFAPIEIDLRYEARESGPFLPVVRNIVVERMRSAHSRYGLYIRGLEQAPVRGVTLRDCTFRGVTNGQVIEGAVDVTLRGMIVEAAPARKEGTR